MKKLSLAIMVLWVFFPFAIKLTEKEGFHPDWFWFLIIWGVMGICGAFATYIFCIMEDYENGK